MAARQLDAIAAADPAEPGRFIAAIVFPDVQMLLVSSRHESADYLAHQIAQRQFRDVYSALHGGPAAGRHFFHDMGCDGLLAAAEDADIHYEGADRQTIFDGNWEAQSLTEAAYAERHKAADERYSRALTVLLEAVKRLAGPSSIRHAEDTHRGSSAP
jgi:hypothetical protein